MLHNPGGSGGVSLRNNIENRSFRKVVYICHIFIYIYTTTSNHHHTVQVARVQVEYLRQWLKEKTPPAQVATADDHHMCKWSICASCWKEKQHQRKLQQVLTTTCASGVSAPVDGRKTPPAQGAKVRTSIRANWSGMQQQLMQREPPYHRPNQDQHGCRWGA